MRLTKKRVEQLETFLRIGNVHYIIKTSSESFESAFERHVQHVTACNLNAGIDWIGIKNDYINNPHNCKHIRLIEIQNPNSEH